MNKRMLSLGLALVLVLALALPALAEDGEKPVTRAGAVTIMFQVLGEMDDPEPAEFTDVPADDPLMVPLSWAVSRGIVNGYGDGAFGPEDPVTRQQLAAMIYRYVQHEGYGFRGMWMFPLDFPDAGEIASYADEAVHWLVMNGLADGSEQGFRPKGTMSADEVVALVQTFPTVMLYGPDEVLECGGISLTIPGWVKGRVITDLSGDPEDGLLFTVSELASVEAARELGEAEDGAGWLFSVKRVTEEELHELLLYDMSGVTPFARDDSWYYLFCQPTDVRLVRADGYTEEALADWSELCQWASEAPMVMQAENPGLTPFHRGNSMAEMLLNRAAYLPEADYLVSTLEFGPLKPEGVEAAPYVERILEGMVLEAADPEETPDGEYAVLRFDEEDERVDFFFMPGKECYIRVVWSRGEQEQLFRAEYPEGTDTLPSAVMQEWYDALAKAQGLK